MALKDMLKRMSAGQAEQEDIEPLEPCDAEVDVTTSIGELLPRTQATITGEIASLRIVPAKDGSAWLEATVEDGTGTLIVLWTGRQRIPGVKPGARLLVTGRPLPAASTGRPTIFNPSYSLLG
jgi:hypothetical protein